MVQGLISQMNQDEVPEGQAPEETIEGQEPLTPEEQDAYDSAMNMAAEMMYSNDSTNADIMTMMTENQPQQGVATAVSFVMSQLETAFKGQLPETVIIPLGDSISDLLMEMAGEAQLFEMTEELFAQIKGNVMQYLFDDYGVDEEEMREMMVGVTDEDLKVAEGLATAQPGA